MIGSTSGYFFFDVETPNCRNDRVCSFAIASESGESFASLVDPETEFHWFCTQIHGITSDQVYGEPNFRYFWERRLQDEFTTKTVVGYNVTFDLRVLTKTLRAYDLDAPVFRYVDVLTAARRYFDLRSYSLSDVMDELGRSFRHHDACEDVLATKIVFDTIAADAPGLLVEKYYQYDPYAKKARW